MASLMKRSYILLAVVLVLGLLPLAAAAAATPAQDGTPQEPPRAAATKLDL